MRNHVQVAVIGGGVVGASVLYHLTKAGWKDVLLIERAELTSGSTWHAAGGMHTVNGDPNVAKLQQYTINLYKELEAISGQSCGMHITGGILLAGTPERLDWLKMAKARGRYLGMDLEILSPAEAKKIYPLMDEKHFVGAMYDAIEGHVDPYGVTHAYAKAAQIGGAEIVRQTRVTDLRQRTDGSWDVITERGNVHAEHVVNAGGLWAREVGRFVGLELPILAMEHQYLITEDLPEFKGQKEQIHCIDFEGEIYQRQERGGMLIGTYERAGVPWSPRTTPWDFGQDLLPNDLERIAPSLEVGFEHFPRLASAGIKKIVNGPFTCAPDGNPLVGPVRGLTNFWVACGVMAGFSQGGGVGLSLAQWMIHGEPGADIYGMDVARYGAFASNRGYLKAMTAQFYKRRFVLTYPNEQLPAGRPLRRAPAYDAMTEAGARWGVSWGLEVPLYFAPEGFVETPTQRRSNAHDIVGAECLATRAGIGLLDTSAFSRYAVTGPDAHAFLDRLLACRIPPRGRARLAPMLSPSGRLMGDLTLLNWDDETFWIMGSYYLRRWHMRWFQAQLPPRGVALRDISDATVGFSIAGPGSRELLQRLTPADVSNAAFPFLACRAVDVGLLQAKLGRLSVAGELGYEINVPAAEHLTLYHALLEAGRDLGLVQIGYNALLSLRLEKSFGIWSREFTWAYTPGMSGLDRFVAFDKGDFIGRDAALAERDGGTAPRRLVTLAVDAADADASGFEPVWQGARRVGFVTSGGYGHCLGKSLALAYLDKAVVAEGARFDVHIVGEKRSCAVIAPSPFDPTGARLRG